jgi:putative Flp pilus-assembly TadE/G-like protein/von Willebrand factor type A domain-containing protein
MKVAASIPARVRRQGGQVVVVVAVFLVAMIGCAAIVFDVGRVYVAQQQLNAAVNAAALAAGQNLPNATNAYSAAVSYSGASGDKNAFGDSNVTVASPNVTFECASHAPNYTSGSCPTDTGGTNCHPTGAQAPTPSGATTCNAVKVSETATVKNTFGSLFFPSFTLTASTIAAARGGSSHPLHVEVILDTTGSMTSSCSGTVTGISSPERIDCAKAGVRALLQALWPCTSSLASCGTATANSGGQLGANVATPVDEVGLMMFPAITGNPPSSTILNKEVDCSNSNLPTTITPTYTAYTYNAGQADGNIPASDDYLGYQAVGLSSDYRPSVANTTLNWTTSNVTEAVDWGQCSGSTYPNGNYYGLKDIGGQGSYLAGAITEAQHLLNQNAKVGVTNAIIVLSDGAMTSKSFDTTPCTTAINAAAQAKAAGTVVYAIGYGADTTACGGSGGQPNALATMTAIASNSETFFNQPSAAGLTAAFQQVATDLTDSRLIPECTAAPPAC